MERQVHLRPGLLQVYSLLVVNAISLLQWKEDRECSHLAGGDANVVVRGTAGSVHYGNKNM
jgi:hypothetical protein